MISLELHISCRSDSNPDPEFDPISAAIFCIHQDQPFDDATHPGSSPHSVGVVLFEGDGQLGVSFDKTGLPGCDSCLRQNRTRTSVISCEHG